MLDISAIGDGFIIAKGVAGYPGLRLNVFLYHVDGILIDTGPSKLSKKIKPFILRYPPKEVVITHIHEDHCGMAYWINETIPEIPIYVHPESMEKTPKPAKLPLYRHLFWGPRKPFKAKPYPENIETDHYNFKVIYTNGHSSDHVVLYEKERGWLFTGDLFITPKPKVLFCEEDAKKTLTALSKILKLDISELFCAHSGHHKKGYEMLKKKKDYLESLYQEISDLKLQGYSLEEVHRRLFPKSSLITYISRGEWSSFNLVKSLY